MKYSPKQTNKNPSPNGGGLGRGFSPLWCKAAYVAGVIVGGSLLVFFIYFIYNNNPSESQLAPKCFWKLATGTDCPGCGFQRALHAFLHGNFADAARYNFFLILALPYLFAVILSDLVFRGERRERWQRFTHSRYTLWAYIILCFFWWVVRNILGI